MAALPADLPFKVEYARSMQSGCRGCRSKIREGTLRIARVFKSTLFDGDQLNWFHPSCFFDVNRPQSNADFEGFDSIRLRDQEYIESETEKGLRLFEFVPLKTVPGGIKTERKVLEARMSRSALRDFSVEYAKTGRAKCRHCERPIAKASVRVKKTVYDTEVGMKFGGEPLWHHLMCFAKERRALGWLGSGEQLPGYETLQRSDRHVIEKLILPIIIVDSDDVTKSAPQMPAIPKSHLQRLQSQNRTYFRFRDFCEKNLSKREMTKIMQLNRQDAPKGKYTLLDALADTLTFGALERCPKCNGQLYIKNKSYRCRGDANDWASCDYTSQTPDRRPAAVPQKIRMAHRFLNRELTADERVFHGPPSSGRVEATVVGAMKVARIKAEPRACS